MPNDTTKILVGNPKVTGAAYCAPVGTALPTNTSSTLNAAFKLVGLIGEDGITEQFGATGTTRVLAMNGSVARIIQTEHAAVYNFTMLETNEISLGVFFHEDNVAVTDPTVSAGTKYAVTKTAKALPRLSWVIELDDDPAVGRLVLPIVQVTETGERKFAFSTSIQYPVTMEAYENAAGAKGFEYWDDGVFAPA